MWSTILGGLFGKKAQQELSAGAQPDELVRPKAGNAGQEGSLAPEVRLEQQEPSAAAQPDELVRPKPVNPWEDESLSPEVRLESYKAFLLERVNEVKQAFESAQSEDERESIRDRYEKTWQPLVERLEGMTSEEFCWWQDLPRDLGKNFLGAEAWSSQGIDVGPVPPIPQAITPELLNLECPLHPGEKIKDTHVLMLVKAKT